MVEVLDISRRDIDAIIDLMEVPDGVVSFTDNYVTRGSSYLSSAVLMPDTMSPLFWVSVATYYCEKEHGNGLTGFCPSWTPEDIATKTFISECDRTYAVIFPPATFRVID